MRTAIVISPQLWLTSAPNPVDPGRVLPNYCGTVSVYEFRGPQRFVRAAGLSQARGKLANPWGEWWTPEAVLTRIHMRLEQFEGWVPRDELRRALPARYRALAAICHDWNDLTEIYELYLPPGEVLEGVAGPAKAQPVDSRQDPTSRNTPLLPGGAEQVFFKVKNPFWIQRVFHW